MKRPLGSIDTRVTMTDSPPDGFLSPSFASVIAFDDPPQHETPTLNGRDPGTRDLNRKGRITTDEFEEALDGRDEDRYPRLELDPAMDKYHTLDGLTEPQNPQNTPASNSGCDSPADVSRRGNGEGLRTSSAPATPALTVNWFEDPPDEDLLYLPGDVDDTTKNQKRRFSADDRPRSISPITVPKEVHPQATADAKLVTEDAEKAVATLRCVRFHPPPDSSPERSPRRSPRPINRPLPSVERKQDYISTYRQQKQNEKWKGPNRQRISPNRSPARASQPSLNHLSGQPGFRFSSPSRSPFKDDTSSSAGLFQSSSDQEFPEMSGALTDELAVTNGFAPSGQAYDLAVISFSLYRFRYPGSSRAGVLQVRMNSTIIPLKPSLQTGKTDKTVVTRMAVDDLLLHTYVIVPAFILRLPLLGLSVIKRFKQSRLGHAMIYLLKTICALALGSLYFVLLRLGHDVYQPESSPPRQKKRRSR